MRLEGFVAPSQFILVLPELVVGGISAAPLTDEPFGWREATGATLVVLAGMELGIRAPHGEMANLIDGFFDKWQLTPSEREVALMVLKGIDNDSIAKMRGTAPGTVRAQCTRIYAKAEVDGRAQLLSIFMEELFRAGEDWPGCTEPMRQPER